MNKIAISTVCIIGFGAFGQLIATHLHSYFSIVVIDPAMPCIDGEYQGRVIVGTIADLWRCDAVILAVPVSEFASLIRSIRDHLRPGSIVIDVGSVKVSPAKTMLEELPPHIEIVGTHPLFGPQSAENGIRGRKIAVCHIRGRATERIAAFLRRVLGLKVIFTTPEDHDKEVAIVQGVTHFIAKVLVRMEPLPKQLTTASFDHLIRAVDMIRFDAPSVFYAIERLNPYASEVRERYFAISAEIREELERQI